MCCWVGWWECGGDIDEDYFVEFGGFIGEVDFVVGGGFVEDGVDVGEGLVWFDELGCGGRESFKGGGSGVEGCVGEGVEEGYFCGDI